VRDSWASWDGNTLALNIQVQPRASQIEIAGVHAGRLKVRLTAAPERGKANEQLLQFLAGEFGVPKTHVSLHAGASGRAKRILVRTPVRQPRWLAAELEAHQPENTCYD
jgi:uncharacterized protein (TIGR00251 family)